MSGFGETATLRLRFAVVAIALVVLGLVMVQFGLARAADRQAGPVRAALDAVAAASADDVWAVGWVSSSGQTHGHILHWDGTSWKSVSGGPSVQGGSLLSGVAATSASNAWAVGEIDESSTAGSETLILQWDGTSWARVPSPSPGPDALLSGVAATSSSNAWAVGSAYDSSNGNDEALILHWDGTSWARVPSPSPGRDAGLQAVAAVSPDNVWAVGGYAFLRGDTWVGRSLILHWNGRSWKRVRSPNPRIPKGGGRDDFGDVAATATDDAWAAGASGGDCGCGFAPGFVERWNGHAWTRVPIPNLRAGVSVSGVAIASTDRTWIAGTEGLGRATRTLLLSCRRSECHRMRTPSPGASASLDQVTVVSPNDAWAVGSWSHTTYGRSRTLILHWNGRKWT